LFQKELSERLETQETLETLEPQEMQALLLQEPLFQETLFLTQTPQCITQLIQQETRFHTSILLRAVTTHPLLVMR
jgi:hypothetical protein